VTKQKFRVTQTIVAFSGYPHSKELDEANVGLLVGGVYEGVGNSLWIIHRVDEDKTKLQWVVASVDGGATAQLPRRDAAKWFTKFVRMADTP
jgi:hypothetical protein